MELAWLACAVGNTRAARFYEKSGWRNAGTFVMMTDTSNGPFPVDQWRFEKRLTRQPVARISLRSIRATAFYSSTRVCRGPRAPTVEQELRT